MRHRGRHIISTAVEHDAVLKTLGELERRGWEVTYLRPDRGCRISLEELEDSLREDTVLVSVMLVNNETGAVMPVPEIARLIKRKNSAALLHTDAVQGFLKLPFTAAGLGADLITVSSHKVHGPKGAGALWAKSGLKLRPLLFGGGQEDGRRSGTEGLPQIAGFGEACRIGREGLEGDMAHVAALRSRLEKRLAESLPEAVVLGAGETVPHILTVSLPGYKSEVLMNFLDAAGVCVSRGSACKKGRRSHVLTAMRLGNTLTDGAIRLSLSRENTPGEMDYAVECLKKATEELLRAR